LFSGQENLRIALFLWSVGRSSPSHRISVLEMWWLSFLSYLFVAEMLNSRVFLADVTK